MPYPNMTVTVTWMDNKQETYRCYGARTENGVLCLNPAPHSSEPARRIPVANVRIWLQEER